MFEVGGFLSFKRKGIRSSSGVSCTLTEERERGGGLLGRLVWFAWAFTSLPTLVCTTTHSVAWSRGVCLFRAFFIGPVGWLVGTDGTVFGSGKGKGAY